MVDQSLFWWVRFPIHLRRFNKLLSEAWIDGVYLTAWPIISLAVPLLILLLGLFEGATHWTIVSVPHGYVSAHVPDFTQMLSLLLVTAICGAFSSQLGLLLVLGFAIGDFFFGAAVFVHGPGFAWNLLHAYPARLVCYLAFFLLAVTPALTAKAMVATLPRWLQRSGTPQLVFSAVIACAVHGVSVYAWTLAATMIIRVHWLWAQQTPPFAVFDFTPLVNPWLPITAMMAMAVRFWLSTKARGKLAAGKIGAARKQMTAWDRQSPAIATIVVGAIGSALATTAVIAGLFGSISRGLAIFALIAGLFVVRSLILPSLPPWVWWARFMNRIPLVLRWAGAISATFFVTRWILADPRRSPQFVSTPGAFGVEISCFLLGLLISIILLPVPTPAESPRKLSKSLQTGAKTIALIVFLGLGTRPVFAGICLDPFCCFGANGLLASLVVAAMVLLAVALLFGGVALMAALVAEVAADLEAGAFFDLFPELIEDLGPLSEETEEAIAEEEGAAEQTWEDLTQEASQKIPDDWGDPQPTKKGTGLRWQDPNNPGNGVRIDMGNPDSPFPSQQVDHVIVRSGGNVIGPDGNPIVGSVAENPQAHIPLMQWLKWPSWNSPLPLMEHL